MPVTTRTSPTPVFGTGASLSLTVPAGVIASDVLIVWFNVTVATITINDVDTTGTQLVQALDPDVGHGVGTSATFTARAFKATGFVAGDTFTVSTSNSVAQKGMGMAILVGGSYELVSWAGLEEPGSSGVTAHQCPDVTALAPGMALGLAADRSSTGWTSPTGWTERTDGVGTGTSPVSLTIATKDTAVAAGTVTGPVLTATNSSTTAALGTIVVPELTAAVSAGSDQGSIEPWSTVTLAATVIDPQGTVVSTSWTQLTGPVVTLSGTGNNRTFSAPATLDGTTLTFRFTATNADSTTSTDDVAVEILPATEFKRVSGAWVPVRLQKF